ncbi:titin [Caerostris darwini]|uniref:Titin n=1 Tax=Caerostris darwini TaxID=1538125 RepID=A0AAV4U283_9ARAC|nr:titin [Caerostris darwini]
MFGAIMKKAYYYQWKILIVLVVVHDIHASEEKPSLHPLMVPPNPSLGDSIEIVCTIKRGSLPVMFSWLHNGQVISAEKQKKITNNERISHFSIGYIQSNDIGNYTCVVSNRYGEDSKTASVIIEDHDHKNQPAENPVVVLRNSSIGLSDEQPVLNPMYVPPNLAIGDNIQLSCIVKRGSYPVNIEWLKNGEKITDIRKNKIINYEDSSHLSIGKIQPDDIGNYTCVAKNSIGQDSNTVTLVIENDHRPPVLSPMFVPPNLAIGDITEIYCNIKRGSLPVAFSWFHNDIELTKKQKYKINNSETSSHLSVGKIQASDIGNYTCVASNKFGRDQGMVSVLIEEAIAEAPVLNPLHIPPNLSLGDNTELLCNLKRGSVPLTFKWFHNGIDVTQKKKDDIVMSKKSTLLSIGTIQSTDIGNYTCIVSNRMGEDRASVQVLIDVYGKEDAPILNPMVIPPNLALGDMTELSCSVKRGSLPISFEWFHNDKLIADHQKYKLSNTQISSLFLIGKVTASDIGNYTCKATNLYGEDRKTANVLIEVSGLEEAPVLSPIFIPPNLAIGDMTEMSCTLKRGSLPIKFEWYHNSKLIQNHQKYKVSSSQIGSHFHIGKISASDIGNYTCKASNVYGEDSKTESVVIEGEAAEDKPVLNPLLAPPNLALGDITELSCTIKRGTFPVTFKWFHNGEEIRSHHKFKISNIKTSSHLLLGEIQASDIGNYTCKAINAYGYDSKTESVVIEEVSAETPLLIPLHIPPNLSIGDNTELFCSLKRGSLPLTFKWLHNGRDVTETKKNDITTSKMSTSLLIGKIQATDIGNYTCVVNNRMGEDRASVQVLIEGFAEEPPVLNPMYVPPNLAIGDNIEIFCIVKRGSYPVQIEWFHNDKKVTSVQKYKITSSESSSHLSIGKIQPDDIGNYTCIAKNRYGQDSNTVVLIIEDGMAEEPVLNPLLIPPNLSLGDNIELLCTLKRGSLPLTFKWLHNEVDVTQKLKSKIAVNKMSTHFSIGKIQATDIGNYTCVVSNRFGDDKGTLQVIIDAFGEGEAPVLNPMFIPPNLAVGDMTELTCTVKRGSLPISFTWYQNHQIVSDYHKYKISSSKISSQFLIGEVTASDIGNYTCKASNTYGEDSKTESVIIEGETADDPPVLNPLVTPPNLALGDITELFCTMKRGSLPITFKWLHDGTEIHSHHKYRITNSKTSSHLYLGEIQASDIGNYTCKAINAFGHDSKTESVVIEVEASEALVLNPLLIPPNLAVNDITEISCSIKRGSTPVTFTWLKNAVDVSGIGSENAPVLNNLLIPPNLALGDITDILCTVKKGSFPMVYKWLYNDREITTHMKYKVTTVGSSSHLSIGKIEATDIGNYTCVVSNSYGQDKNTVQVILEANRSDEAPILFPLMVPSTSIGDNTDILCTLKRGSMPVTFKWLYNGQDVTSISKYKIINSDKSSHFSIGNIQPYDIGNYTCVATNNAGVDSKITSIVIEASEVLSDPPVLYPLMVPSNPTLGDDTDIVCKLRRGTRPVNFEWFHNGNSITVGSKAKITITDRRSVFSMGNIQVTDIGNYTCVASNAFGRDSKTESVLIEGYQNETPILHPLSIPPDLGIGDSLDITCSLKRGSIPVSFEWRVNNQTPIKRVGIQINTSHKRSVYIIDSISAADVGNYTCIASNTDGSDRVYAALDVEARISGIPVLHPLFIPPDISLGDSLDITCSLKRGNVPISFEWKLNEKKITGIQGIRINTSERRSVCIIQNINHDHIGNYTCKASNVEGFDEAHTELKVEVSVCEKPDLYPMFVPPNIGLGDPVDLTCSLRKGNLPITFTWLQNGRVVNNASKHNIKISITNRRSVFIIEKLDAESVGNYTCKAINNIGFDEESVVVYAEVPPHWTKEPMDTTAAKGSGLIIDCTATGHPTPRVSWNRQKGTEHRENIRSEGQWSTASNGSLIFSRIDESDAGVYVCEAHNGIGPGISKSIQISVHAPPELKKKFERVTVRRGHTARLMCEITGDQPLHVSWKKDNQDVNIQFGTRFEVVKDTTDYGSKSELLIHDSQKADVGSYVCHARNKFGNDEGKVKLIVLEPPSPPSGIRTSEVQVRSIRLSWQPSSSDEGLVENYVVRYWRNDEKRGKLHQVTLPAVQTSVTIPNLHPGTSYSVQVFAQNNVGQGDPSTPITFRTVEEAPDGAPLDLRVEPVSSKAIRVSWKPPQRHHWNGPLRGYYVGNKVAHSSSPFTYQTVETTDRRGGSLLIQGLMKATTYTIVVKAFNAAGSGPPTHELQVTTLEEDPPSPPIVGVADVTASSVGIHWNIGSDKQPSVVQYLLEFREEGEEWDHIHLPGERNSFYLTGLKGSTRYELRIAAYNVFGRGEFSPTIDFTTGLAEISVPFSTTHSNTPFYFRPYFVIPVAASVVVIVTTVVIAWAQAGSYTRLKSQMPNPGGAIVIGHQSGSSR